MSRPESIKTMKVDDGYDVATDPWAESLSDSNLNHILLSLSPYDFFFGPKSRVTPDVEPPPRLDYRSIHMMLALCRPGLSKHYMKRWDYLADSRRKYLFLHHKFYWAYHALQDVRAYEEIMVKKKGDLVEQIRDWEQGGVSGAGMEKKRRELEDVMFLIERNRAEMPELTEKVKHLAKVRDQVAAWLSDLKLTLLRNDLKTLVYMAKKGFEVRQRQKAKEAGLIGDSSLGEPPRGLSVEVPEPSHVAFAVGYGEDQGNHTGSGLLTPVIGDKMITSGNEQSNDDDLEMEG